MNGLGDGRGVGGVTRVSSSFPCRLRALDKREYLVIIRDTVKL